MLWDWHRSMGRCTAVAMTARSGGGRTMDSVRLYLMSIEKSSTVSWCSMVAYTVALLTNVFGDGTKLERASMY